MKKTREPASLGNIKVFHPAVTPAISVIPPARFYPSKLNSRYLRRSSTQPDISADSSFRGDQNALTLSSPLFPFSLSPFSLFLSLSFLLHSRQYQHTMLLTEISFLPPPPGSCPSLGTRRTSLFWTGLEPGWAPSSGREVWGAAAALEHNSNRATWKSGSTPLYFYLGRYLCSLA